MERSYASIYFFIVTFFLLFSCKNSNYSEFGEANICNVSEENGGVVIICESAGIQGLQEIDLSLVWDKCDDFYFPYLGGNYRSQDEIFLDLKNNGDELTFAEEQIHFYPSIWSAEGDPVIQFIELSDLEYVKHIPLEIKNGVIVYPQYRKGKDVELDKYFSSITKKQLRQVVENYYKSDDCVFYERKNVDRKYYLNYVAKYKQGDYKSGEVGAMFDILDGVHEIVLTYQSERGKYAKKIYYIETHGN